MGSQCTFWNDPSRLRMHAPHIHVWAFSNVLQPLFKSNQFRLFLLLGELGCATYTLLVEGNSFIAKTRASHAEYATVGDPRSLDVTMFRLATCWAHQRSRQTKRLTRFFPCPPTLEAAAKRTRPSRGFHARLKESTVRMRTSPARQCPLPSRSRGLR